mmetsp:Transcript_18426/g.53129  ORF Transcript_18426/g.53129 Transcript_18426/m.53129 type:complete len:209 (-) Transcript_18426:376-1002(-)
MGAVDVVVVVGYDRYHMGEVPRDGMKCQIQVGPSGVRGGVAVSAIGGVVRHHGDHLFPRRFEIVAVDSASNPLLRLLDQSALPSARHTHRRLDAATLVLRPPQTADAEVLLVRRPVLHGELQGVDGTKDSTVRVAAEERSPIRRRRRPRRRRPRRRRPQRSLDVSKHLERRRLHRHTFSAVRDVDSGAPSRRNDRIVIEPHAGMNKVR